MKRGELWWVTLDERRPVVLLKVGGCPEIRAVQVVAPATMAKKQGFVIMTGEQAVDEGQRRHIIETAGPDVQAIGIEVSVGTHEGLAAHQVVRVALPRSGKIFCTETISAKERPDPTHRRPQPNEAARIGRRGGVVRRASHDVWEDSRFPS